MEKHTNRFEQRPVEGTIFTSEAVKQMEKLLSEGKKLEIKVKDGQLAVWAVKSSREI